MINQWSICKNLILIGAIISAALFPVVSFGATGINKQLPYQGVLKTANGVKVSDGNYDIIFKIYDAPAGGNILWNGTHTAANGNAATVTDGVFSVLLGSGNGNAMAIDFSGDTLYLGIKVGADSEMTPRKRIGAAGYAFNADKIDGVDSLSFLRNDQANTMQSSLTVNGALTFNSSTVSMPNNLNFDANTLFVDAANNRVGVGTNVPGAQLDVATPDNDQVVKLQRTGTNAGVGYIYSNGNEMFGVNDGTNYPFMIRQTAPGWALYVNTDGRIGLNTGSPNQGKMEVKGGSVCVDTNSDNNAVSCIANESDARLKENIMTIDGALDKIMRLRGVYFDWKVNDSEVLKHYPLIARFASSTRSLGLIAQEAQGIVPEAIMQETVGDDEVQYLQLDYDKIVPLLAEGIKEIASFAGSFKQKLIIWLADTANGIGDLFAKKIHTETICFKKSDGNEYCVNGDDLEMIMSGNKGLIITNQEQALDAGQKETPLEPAAASGLLLTGQATDTTASSDNLVNITTNATTTKPIAETAPTEFDSAESAPPETAIATTTEKVIIESIPLENQELPIKQTDEATDEQAS